MGGRRDRHGFTEAELAAHEWSKRHRPSSRGSDSGHDGRFREGHSRSRLSREHRRGSSKDSHGDRRRRDESIRSRSRSGSTTRRRGRRARSRTRSKSLPPDSLLSDASGDSDLPPEPFNPLKLAYRKDRGGRRDKHKALESDALPDRWDHDLYDDEAQRAAARAKYNEEKDDASKGNITIDTAKSGWRSKAGGVYIPDPTNACSDYLYSDFRPKRPTSRAVKASPADFERPDPVYTLDE